MRAAQRHELWDATDWTAADGALLDELVHLLGPRLRRMSRMFLASLILTLEIEEVFTTRGPALLDARSRPLRCAARDVRPPAHRRGTRCQPDAVAHAAAGGSASWTIVGDPAQSAWTDAEEANRAIEEIIGTAPVRHFRMSTNYRSPSEVYDLAAKIVIADFPVPTSPLRRATGHQPRLWCRQTPSRTARRSPQP